MTMFSLIIGTVSGLVGGLSYGLVGYKNSSVNEFNWKKLVLTVAPTTVIGAIAGYQDLPYNAIASGSIGLGVTKLITKVTNLIISLFNKKK